MHGHKKWESRVQYAHKESPHTPSDDDFYNHMDPHAHGKYNNSFTQLSFLSGIFIYFLTIKKKLYFFLYVEEEEIEWQHHANQINVRTRNLTLLLK